MDQIKIEIIRGAYPDHLLLADEAVLVDVVEVEAPEDLLLDGSLGEHGEEVHEVPEGDGARVVLVDGPELELETKVIRRFPKISQSRRRPLH